MSITAFQIYLKQLSTNQLATKHHLTAALLMCRNNDTYYAHKFATLNTNLSFKSVFDQLRKVHVFPIFPIQTFLKMN